MTKLRSFLPSKLLLFIAALLLTNQVHGQLLPKIAVSHLSTLLEQPTILAIHKDSKGFLWVGTQEGLYKFYGKDFDFFNSDIDNPYWIPSSDIRGIVEDDEGNTVVATYGAGLLRWNENTANFERVFQPRFPEDLNVTKVYKTKTGELLVTSKENLIVLSPNLETSLYNHKLEGAPIDLGVVTSFVQVSKENSILGTSQGLYLLSENNYQLKRLEITNTKLSVSALATDSTGTVFVGTDDGHVIKLSSEFNETSSAKIIDSVYQDQINDLLLYDDALIIATNTGLYVFSDSLTKLAQMNHNNSALATDYIINLYQDNTTLWIGTYNGLYIASFNNMELFTPTNSNISEDVLAFEEGRDGKIWIGTYSGLYYLNEVEGANIRIGEDYLVDQRVMTISSFRDELWVGFYRGGVQIIEDPAFKPRHRTLEGSSDLHVTKIHHTDSGDAWIATYNKGIFRYVDGRLQKASSLDDNSVITILETAEGLLYASSENQIYLYNYFIDSFQKIVVNGLHSAESRLILSLTQGPNGKLYLGTKDNGLYWLKSISEDHLEVSAIQIAPSTGLEKQTVYGVVEDNDGHLWCSTQNGLWKLDANGKPMLRIGRPEGLQASDFNFGAYFIDSKDRIYFGGINGYNRVNPDNYSHTKSIPKIILSKIYTPREPSQKIDVERSLGLLVLSHKSQLVTFHFNVLDFLDPTKNLYRYKLIGFNRDWIDSGNKNTATYTNLPPGDYTLRVQGANSSGVWNRDGISIQVKVLPPPWLTWWAFCFYALLTFLALWIAKRFYDAHSIKNRALILAREMHEAADRAEDDLHEQHEIQDLLIGSFHKQNSANLALIQDYYQDDAIITNPAVASEPIAALQRLAQSMFFEGELLEADLNQYVERVLPGILAKAKVPIETITTINSVSPAHVPADIATPVALILYELLSNCVDHAFVEDSLANFITVEFGLDADSSSYHLSVIDSGIGLPADISPSSAISRGFKMIRKLAAGIGATIESDSSAGSRITLIIPSTSHLAH